LSNPENPTPDAEREELAAKRKQQIWLIAILMTVTFCAGTSIVFLIAWLLIR
jgi:hypothetical protein